MQERIEGKKEQIMVTIIFKLTLNEKEKKIPNTIVVMHRAF